MMYTSMVFMMVYIMHDILDPLILGTYLGSCILFPHTNAEYSLPVEYIQEWDPDASHLLYLQDVLVDGMDHLYD